MDRTDLALKNVMAKKNWQIVKELGSGAFGDVFEVRGLGFDKNFAVKSSSVLEEAEVFLWGNLEHENIVELKEVISIDRTSVLFTMPLMPRTLMHLVENSAFRSDPNSVEYLAKWTKDVVKGVQYLHANNVAHLDIKSDNILISEDFQTAKIADFSFISPSKHPAKRWGLPKIYQPPEAFPSQ